MTVLESPALEPSSRQQDELPVALTLSADALVRGKRDELLDRMEELTHWRIAVESEANAMHDRIKTWNVPASERSSYVLRYRRLDGLLKTAERVASTLNAELARRA